MKEFLGHWASILLWELGDRIAAFDERRANRASQDRFLSAHREQGTPLSQPAFALAQLMQAMGVRPAVLGTSRGASCVGSLASW